MTCIECSVTIKDENKKLVNKYLKYEPLTMDLVDAEIIRMVHDTMDQFKVDASEDRPTIVIKASMVFQ